MIDLNNPEFVCEWSPVAEWKRELLIYLGKKFNLQTLIETGTCYGETVKAVCEHFSQVHSIELGDVLFEKASKNLADIPNAHLYHGSSGDLLKDILAKIPSGPLLFWLDAHFSWGETVGSLDEGYGPLPKELETIFAMRPDSLILIDDVGPNYIDHEQFHVLKNSDWKHEFRNGVAIVHHGGYQIPERF